MIRLASDPADLTVEQLLVCTVAGFTYRRNGEEATLLGASPSGVVLSIPTGAISKFEYERADVEGMKEHVRTVLADLQAMLGATYVVELTKGTGVSVTRADAAGMVRRG